MILIPAGEPLTRDGALRLWQTNGRFLLVGGGWVVEVTPQGLPAGQYEIVLKGGRHLVVSVA